MREMFPGFYYEYPTGEELANLWQKAVFVFDANMLLNVYRYSPEAVNRYFEILVRLKNQIWVPYQAVYEYHQNRKEAIHKQNKKYNDISNDLENISRKLRALLGNDRNKHIIDPQVLINKILDEIETSKSAVKEKKKQDKTISNILKNDTYRGRLEELFRNKVGKPYLKNELQVIYQQAEQRFALEIPPGWMDEATKDDVKKYGDVVLWFQIIDYVRYQQKPVIFVTDDVKRDWWKIKEDQTIEQPLPELVQEMFNETGMLLFMYQGYDFIDNATKFLNLEEKPDIIKEAKEISEQNREYLEYARLASGVNRFAYQVEISVQRWLEEEFPQPDFNLIANRSPRTSVDFIVENIKSNEEESENSRLGIIVKYARDFFSLRENLKFWIEKRITKLAEELDSSILVLVTEKDALDKNRIYRLQHYIKLLQEDNGIDVYKNTSIVLGYIENERFNVAAELL